MTQSIKEFLWGLKKSGNYRVLRYVEPISETRILYRGREYLNLMSNSYLGLHMEPSIIEYAKMALERYGVGNCSSRSLSGSLTIYRELENEFAKFKGYERCLVFSNGFMANIAILSTVLTEEDTVISDELNHSSIIHGIRLSRAKKLIFRHRDLSHLEELIKNNFGKGRIFVVTETVFSMDGDIAPLKEIHELKRKYDFYIIVDDAHGTGVFGRTGSGVEEELGIKGSSFIHMATFGKAFGSYGASVLAEDSVIRLLINRAKSFMYTTALPPAVVAGSLAALKLLEENPSMIEELWRKVRYVRSALKEMGFDLKDSVGPIIPILVGDDMKALRFQRALMQRGLFVQAIRPPTVPKGTSRIRLTITRGFSEEDLDFIVSSLVDEGRKFGIIP